MAKDSLEFGAGLNVNSRREPSAKTAIRRLSQICPARSWLAHSVGSSLIHSGALSRSKSSGGDLDRLAWLARTDGTPCRSPWISSMPDGQISPWEFLRPVAGSGQPSLVGLRSCAEARKIPVSQVFELATWGRAAGATPCLAQRATGQMYGQRGRRGSGGHPSSDLSDATAVLTESTAGKRLVAFRSTFGLPHTAGATHCLTRLRC